MKCRVVFAIFCVVVSLYAVFLFNLASRPYLIPEKNYNRMTHHFSFHEEDRLQRTETKKTLENERGIQLSNKLQKNNNKMKISETAGTKHSQVFAPRTNLIILSPGRGGSSFLGAMFDSNPEIMYWFEPLHIVRQSLIGKEQI